MNKGWLVGGLLLFAALFIAGLITGAIAQGWYSSEEVQGGGKDC